VAQFDPELVAQFAPEYPDKECVLLTVDNFFIKATKLNML
jgi:hypothetical protein